MCFATIQAQTVIRLHCVELALRALVSTHPSPKALQAAMDREFAAALQPDAAPEAIAIRDAFCARLREAPPCF